MNTRKCNNGNGKVMDHSNMVTLAKKPKTPAGSFRYKGKIYPMCLENLPKEKLWCKYCRANNAKVIGTITVNGEIHFVIRCVFHFNETYALDLHSFKRSFPSVNIPNEQLSNEKYPIQRSYCKECHATTGKVIGESMDGKKYQIKCESEECNQSWFEDKESFKTKYIGDEYTPPIYRQTTPRAKILKNWSDDDLSNKPFEGALKDFTPAKQKEKEPAKEILEPSNISKSRQIIIEVPAGTIPSIQCLEGKICITFN